ncbi:hypothetical protein IX307_000129 [Bacteroides pyogenes]|nr:hypothetical protein [Bacteroides pyogenes]MBR8723818.1 hypothetical protein [Bacteroides pyogenes]MBR8737315.1 hypothetical protein [Bacteroides pyogenes]MBR8752942.1 hypothetical protein [Bacteroides pyogenes]MBR8785833.1 hypothetical protein [Bacteroides pyogenes]
MIRVRGSKSLSSIHHCFRRTSATAAKPFAGGRVKGRLSLINSQPHRLLLQKDSQTSESIDSLHGLYNQPHRLPPQNASQTFRVNRRPLSISNQPHPTVAAKRFANLRINRQPALTVLSLFRCVRNLLRLFPSRRVSQLPSTQPARVWLSPSGQSAPRLQPQKSQKRD